MSESKIGESPTHSRYESNKEIEIEIKTSPKKIAKPKVPKEKPKSSATSNDEKSTFVFICYIIFMIIFIAFISIEYPIYDANNLIGPIYDNIKPDPDAIASMSDIKEYLTDTANILYDESSNNTAYNCHTSNCFEINSNQSNPSIYHFYNKFNYLVGCRLSSSHYKASLNNDNFSSAFPYYRSLGESADFNFDAINNKVETSSIFIGNVNKSTQSGLVSDYLAHNIGYNLKSIQIDFIYFNANAQIASAFLINLKVTKGGLINVYSNQMFFFPTAFNYRLYQHSKIIAKLVLIAIIYTCLLATLVNDIRKLIVLIKDAIISGKFQIHWTLLLELISVVFILIIVTYWGYEAIKISVFKKFELPVNEAAYDYYFASSTSTYYLIRGYGISLLLLFIRILSITYQKFPAFDILFMSFSPSIRLLLCFTVITIALLMGFSLAANRIFGVNGIKYSTIMSSLMELFKSGIGLSIYQDLYNSDRIMGALFYLIYVLIFYIIISKLSISFIIGAYHQKWEANHERVSANARLLSLKTQDFLAKLYRLFTCKDPYSTGTKNCCKILRSNINQLNEKGCPYTTKEQEEHNMENARQQILLEQAYKREFLQMKVQCIFIGKNTANIMQNPPINIRQGDPVSHTILKKDENKDASKDEVLSEPAIANLRDSCRANDKSTYYKNSKSNKKYTAEQIKCKYEKALADTGLAIN